MNSDSAMEIGFRPPAGAGLWLIDTCNPNCWDTGARQILQRTAADIVLMQETKAREDKCDQKRGHALKLGWRAALSPALTTAVHGASGGVAVCARRGLGMEPHAPARDGFQHRIGGAWVGRVVRGGVHFVSVYPKDGDQLGETNLAVLTELAAVLGAIRGPWIVGGDWNMAPELLRSSGWLGLAHGCFQAP